MKLRHKQTGEIRYVVKCRGCWERVDSPLDFNQFKVCADIFFFCIFYLHRLWSMRMGVVRSGNRCCWRGHICSPIGSKDKLQLEARKGKLFAFPKKKKEYRIFQALRSNL
jgi:hypothetical protein